MKRIIFIIVLLVIAISLSMALMNNTSINLSDIDSESKTIVLITKMKDGDYWKSVVKGAEAAEQEFGITLIYDAPIEENDIEGQIEMVDFYIEREVDGIVLAASDFKALVPVVEKANNRGIPVVLIDSSVDTDAYYKSFSTDNYLAGKQAAEELIEMVGSWARVGIISFVQGSENAIARENGFRDALSNYDQIEILDTKYCMSSIEIAETHAMIFMDQEADVIVGLNAIASTGLGLALERHKDALGIGFDATSDEIVLLDSGALDATIVQNPFGMGYLGVKYASGVEDYEYLDKDNLIETYVITKDNMFDKENQKLIFPFNIK